MIRYCKRCGTARHFNVRRNAKGRLVECIACCRRRGRERAPERVSYNCMIQRCTNPNAWNWKYYGGRGITVCDRWLNSYGAFVEDMGPRPSGKTLDRKDANGPYSYWNCRWATAKEQIANRTASGDVVVYAASYNGKRKNYGQN